MGRISTEIINLTEFEMIQQEIICGLQSSYLFHSTQIIIIIIIIIALDNAPYKTLHKLKSACFIRKNNSEQVRLQVFRKSRWTNRQAPQFDRQLIPTAGTSNSLRLSNPSPSCGQAQQDLHEQRISKPTNETAEPLVQKATR